MSKTQHAGVEPTGADSASTSPPVDVFLQSQLGSCRRFDVSCGITGGRYAVARDALAMDAERFEPGDTQLAEIVPRLAVRRGRDRVRERTRGIAEEVGDEVLVQLEPLEDRVELLQERPE